MKAAFYEKDVTPPLGGFMDGHFIRNFAEDVKDPLYVRSVVIDNDVTTVAIVSIDACYLPDDMHDIVTKRIKEYTGIEPENVLLSATHTHKGMPINDDPAIDAHADEAYKDVVYRLIADCVFFAWKRLEDVSMNFGSGCADDISFNRNFVLRDGTYWMNEHNNPDVVGNLAGTDPEVPFVFCRDSKGNPKGAIVSYAVHNCGVPGIVYSGGFVSILQNELKKKYGNDFVTVFLLGTCGDINHVDPKLGSMPGTRYVYMGERLAEEVINAEKISEPIVDDTIIIRKELVSLPVRKHTDESVLSDIGKFLKLNKHVSLPISAIRNIGLFHMINESSTASYYLQAIRIGDVYIYAYPGEIYVDFGLDVKKNSPSRKNIVASQSNGACGYVAISKAYEENSRLYETFLSRTSFLDKEAGYIMRDKLIEFGNELSR